MYCAGVQVVGRFRLGALVGEGGTALVYGAEDAAGLKVAVKVLRPELRHDAAMGERMRREAEALGRIACPHVVPFVEAGEDPTVGPYVATVRVIAPRLSEVLASQPDGLGPARACRIVSQVLDGLAALHDHGVVHRDVKPDNVFIETRGDGDHALLFDLGAGALTGSEPLTAAHRVMGSPFYASPERIAGAPADARSDVWAAGVLLYVCLTGTEPFAGADLKERLAAICDAPPTPLAAVSRGVPTEVAAVVAAALEKAPAARFADARTMAAALRRAGRGLGY